MPQSWRISVREIDRSQTLIPAAGTTGAMVVDARRGPRVPQYISARQEQRITDLFGDPSTTYPDVWEAIEYNRTAPIWVASPFSDSDTYSGVVVTSGGTVQLASDGPLDSELDSFSFSSSDEYFALFARSPSSEDNWGAQVTYNTESELFTVVVYYTSDGGTTWTERETYTVSPIEGKLDGFGRNVYVENILSKDDSDFLISKANANADLGNGFTDDASPTLLTGGFRTAADATSIGDVWDSFQQGRKYDADIFMSPLADSTIVTKFDTLRSSYQKYAYYILPLPMSEDVTTAISTKEGYSVSNAGLAFYWNHGRVRDTYNGGSFWTSLIGRVGTKLAAMEDIYNGGAPAWTDENNHGGQLGSGILELEYDPTEDELQTLDESGINAIVFDPNYGVMISSHRTGQSPNLLSDNSWIAHRRLFDYIIENIVEQVLPFQVVKLNDESHRQRAASQAEALISPVQAEGLLRDFAVVCDRSNNTDEVLAKRQFILDVFVQVTPYAETVQLRFQNLGQTTSVEEFVS
jgi:hypothetical protein